MKIGLIGATQGVGKQFLLQALAAKHTVIALARTPSKLDDVPANLKAQLTIVEGDVMNRSAVDKVVAGQDVIVNALGSKSLRGGDVDICSKGSQVIIDSMLALGVKRTFVVTSFGTNESYNDMDWKSKTMFFLLLRNVIADKAKQEKLYFDSALDWTIVRPAGLQNKDRTGVYRHGLGIKGGMIARADVADFIVKQLESQEYLKKSPTLAY